MEQLEFAKFGMAITVDGKTVMSVHTKDYLIHKDGPEFSIQAKRGPQVVTYTAVTNVSEWRKLAKDESTTKPSSKAKS